MNDNIKYGVCLTLALVISCLLFANSFSQIEEYSLNQEFVAGTYNIRFDGQQDVESGNGWDIRKDHVSDVILNHQLDIVGTQEGSTQQLEDLRLLLGEYEYHAHPYGGNSGTIHNAAIFYKPALFDLLESGVFWLSPTPDQPSFGWDATDRRICQWVKFKHKPSGHDFFYFNAHFFWQGITARQGSGPVIVSKINAIAGDLPVILVGDMNSSPSSYQMMVIKELLQDSFDSENNNYEGIQETNLGGGNFQGAPYSRIDYLFTSTHFTVMDYLVGTDTYLNIHNEETYPSDHLPVICKVAWIPR